MPIRWIAPPSGRDARDEPLQCRMRGKVRGTLFMQHARDGGRRLRDGAAGAECRIGGLRIGGAAGRNADRLARRREKRARCGRGQPVVDRRPRQRDGIRLAFRPDAPAVQQSQDKGRAPVIEPMMIQKIRSLSSVRIAAPSASGASELVRCAAGVHFAGDGAACLCSCAMIGVAGEYRYGTIELFGQHHARQHMWPGCRAEGEGVGCAFADLRREAT